jgi:glycine/D-amino acid oxidase-like deaminating enzyme
MSGRSSALIRMHYTFRPEVELAVSSWRDFLAWPETMGGSQVFRPVPFVRIVAGGEMEALKANVAMQWECGAVVELVDRAQLAEMAPAWNLEDVNLAAYEPKSGYGDGAQVASDFLAGARQAGVRYFPDTRATGLRAIGDRVTGVYTTRGVLEASLVICATNVWTTPLLRTVGWEAPLATELHTVAIVRRREHELRETLSCIDSVSHTYFRPASPGSTLVGSFYGRRGVDPEAIPQSADGSDVAELVASASGRVPSLADGGIAGSVVGLYDMTPDTRPIIGPVPTVDGCMVVAGFSGMGFKISPAVGRSVASQVTARPTFDLSPFSPHRFAVGQAITAPHEYQDDLNSPRVGQNP